MKEAGSFIVSHGKKILLKNTMKTPEIQIG
jgi:hypothetical protein